LVEAVRQSPKDMDARRHLAEALWQSGATDEALQHMEAAVEIAPNDANTRVRAGEMRLAMGQVSAALASADAALALDRTLARAWALRGRVYRQCDQPEQALADVQQSLRYNPQAVDVLLEAAELQYQLGRPQRCLTTLHHLLDVYSPGEEPRRALWLEGLAFKATNRPLDAVASLHAASMRGEPQPDVLYQLADAQRAVGDVHAARSTVQRALTADSEHQQSKSLLAQLSGGGDADGTYRR
jgi:tetratricopeptide (TPR) repeat protein